MLSDTLADNGVSVRGLQKRGIRPPKALQGLDLTVLLAVPMEIFSDGSTSGDVFMWHGRASNPNVGELDQQMRMARGLAVHQAQRDAADAYKLPADQSWRFKPLYVFSGLLRDIVD